MNEITESESKSKVVAEVLMFLGALACGLFAGMALEAHHPEKAVTCGLWSLGFFMQSAGYKAGRK